MKREEPSRAAESMLVQIEKPVYGGAFLARVEGKAVFVPLTLPGEQARVRIVEDRRGYAMAEAEAIVSAAPERTEPACPHFAACGGCAYQHAPYAQQLNFKEKILRETLERAGVQPPEQIDVLSAEPWGYRNRIRLAFDVTGNVGYRGRRSHAVIPLTECPIAAPLLVKAALIAAELLRTETPSLKPSEIALFLRGDEAALLVGLTVRNGSKKIFEKFAQALKERVPELAGAELLVEEIARGRRPAGPPRTMMSWGWPSILYSAGGFDYRVDQGAFFQVNRFLVDALLERVTAGHKGRVAWDLFAGVGLFARRLTENFAQVVAVESAPLSTAALKENLQGTGGRAVAASTLEFLRRPEGRQTPDLIVVDPPRMGLGAEVVECLAAVAAPAVAYVSCDPATLARDLKALLAAGYTIQSVAVADLFPQTFHLETVVQLRKA
ncbi:23S rRNA (uracil(1939)-C(5))-methyltransferase RlmD [Telmatobacter bradus]|uniref:23S rRNA (uracil(1939)-C(5))-methyltransferase RlmD n=1 Tax=Telmatobacter bradus TaxID=474953 RepID=UPI003B439EE3